MRSSFTRAIVSSRSPEHFERLNTVLFHKKIGTYLEKSERVGELAAQIARRHPRDAGGRGVCPRGRPLLQGRPRYRHGARADRVAGHDGRHLRARRWPAGGSLEGDLLPLPAGWCRSRRAADERAAWKGGDRLGRRLAGRQARHHHQHVCRGRTADRLARSVRLAPGRPGHRPHPRRSSGAHRTRSAVDAGGPR